MGAVAVVFAIAIIVSPSGVYAHCTGTSDDHWQESLMARLPTLPLECSGWQFSFYADGSSLGNEGCPPRQLCEPLPRQHEMLAAMRVAMACSGGGRLCEKGTAKLGVRSGAQRERHD
jgi:hypothetical protein